MIRLGLIVLALFYLALPAMAQNVQIRSGEHAEFSRLTLNLPERVGWSVAPSEVGAYVIFAGGTFDVDPGMIFERIPRARLTDARWNAAQRRIELTFGCDCEVNGFWFGGSMLVLDVSERDSERAVQPDEPAHAAEFAATTQSISTANTLLTPFPDRATSEGAEASVGAPSDGDIVPVDQAQRRLLLQISRATAQGLLSPAQRLPQPGQAVADQAARDASTAMPDEPAKTPQDALANLRVNSRIDLDFLGTRRVGESRNEEIGCLPDDMLDLASWGSDQPFGDQIARMRLQLTGEFDEVDTQAAKELAQLYLYFGFGAEARDILRLLEGDHKPDDLLLALSEIAEQGFAQPGSPLANQLGCGSIASLWAALSYIELPQNAVIDTDAILRGFSALPIHLRHYYGPVLSRRFIDAGRPEFAARLFRVMDRAGQAMSAEGEMVKAQTDLANGVTDTVTDRLERVVDSNVESSAAALIAMIETRVKRGEAVSRDEAELAGAFAFEKRNEPVAPELHAAHIRALAASAAFDEAQAVYTDRKGQIDPARLPQLRTDIVKFLIRDADDITFLRLILSDAFSHLEQPDPLVAHALAERMLEAGFPAQAAEVLLVDLPPNSDTFHDRRLLRGEVALALGQPRQALRELLDLTGPRASLLRARALSEAGDHAAAHTLFLAANAEDEAQRSALFDGVWAGAGRAEDMPVPSGIDGTAQTDRDGPAAPDLSALESRRALIDESSATRDALAQLFATYPDPRPDPAAR